MEIIGEPLTIFKHKEGKPEKLFRIFYKAFLEGNEKTIKPLIEAHEHQSVLWEGAYPDDVGELLNQIHQTQHIKRIYESADKTKVKLIVADFPAPFEMNFRDGSWKIDASPLINLQMSQKKT